MKRNSLFRYWLALALYAICVTTHAQTSPVFDIVSLNGKYGFAPAVVPDPLVGVPSGTATTGYSFQWQMATTPVEPFSNIAGATSATLSFSSALTATTWYRRVATKPGATTEISNTVKYELVGTQWENMNYTREHTVLVPGQTTWQQVDALSIGSKLVATAYYDGLGRTIQQVSTGTATPTSGSTWGDLVQHTDYDSRGLSPRQYLPFSTTSNPGKYKPTAGSLQAAYYTANYADSKPYAEVQYEQSPMARVLNAKAPGGSWNAGNGSGSQTLVNTLADDVKLFEIGNNATDVPVLNSNTPTYAAGTLLKVVGKDEQLKDVVTFYNANGLPVLKKVQLTGTDANPYSGWICTYYVYDLLGNLRCEINPEGVSWLLQNNWSFAASNGSTVFAEQCFVYQYDERGRTTYKKQPGQQPLYMVYDSRDRLVLTQDGNQRLKTPTQEWTAYVYDELDRPVSTYLYLTNAAITTLRQNAHNNPTIVSTAEQNNSSICTLLSTRYYDDYSFAGAVAFDQTAANSAAVVPAGAGVLVIAKTNRTTGFATGSITRVLGTSSFLVSTMYYDEEGSPIQSIEGNIKGGNDITTTQYGWDGRVLATATKHGLPGGAYHNHEILSKYNYDNIGRLTGTEQKIGANAWKLMSTKTFDDLGRTSTKRLDPAYNGHFSGIGTPGGGLETLTYSYNVQGTLIAINRAYALKEAGYNKWSNFFGLYLGYDANPGNVFDNSPRLNGQLRGVVWNTQGDDAQRRYQYSYDNAGRMTHANFADKATTAAAWSNTQLNFSETGNNETTGIAYSLNGNISNLKRYGHQMGQANAVTVDMLMYSYSSFSNKLLSVTDITSYASPTNPTTVGDFKEANTSNNDYEYDANGNLTKDLNKAIKDLAGTNTYGIQYNHLDKPTVVNIAGKGTITYTYTVGGQRLKRAFAKADGSATQVTWYMGAYIYTEVTSATPALAKPFDLQSIELGEARVRRVVVNTADVSLAGDDWQITPNITLPTGGGVYDYYISDHRSDVRLILTEEQRYSIEKATMEQDNLQTGRAAFEQSLFGSQVGNTRIGKSAAPGWVSNTSSFISQLNAATASKVGPGRMLKVMAGDLVHASTQYYYPAAITNSTTSSIATQVLQALASNLLLGSAGTSATVKNATSAIQTNLGNTAALTNLLNSNTSNTTGTQPKAFLNVLFFDERFNFVAEGSTQIRVATAGDNAPPLAITNLKVPKNGFAYIYVSNESSTNVFFDNLTVRHDRGRIIEENHYYAFGLKIPALSSKSFEALPNAYQYQGDYAEFDDDLGWNDFQLRSYDPQIGRFLQHDPYDQFASGYVGMGNDPGNMVDPTGGFSGPGSGCAAAAGMVGYGGMAAGNAVRGISTTVTTIAQVSSIALKGAGLVNTISSSGKSLSSSAATNSSMVYNSGGSASSSGNFDDGGGGSNPCNCPPGYSSTPKPGGDQHPYFTDPDFAAQHWVQKILPIAISATQREKSSLLFSVTIKNNTMYSYSTPSAFPASLGLPINLSPGYATSDRKYHESLPKYAKIIGHLHFHNDGSVKKKDALTKQNERFSRLDQERLMRGNLDYAYFYVLGGTGELWGNYPKDMALDSDGWYDDRQGTQKMVDGGYYNNTKKVASLCPCYKQ